MQNGGRDLARDMNQRWDKIGKEDANPQSLSGDVRRFFGPKAENAAAMPTERRAESQLKTKRKKKKFAGAKEDEPRILGNAGQEPRIAANAGQEPRVAVNAGQEPRVTVNAEQEPRIEVNAESPAQIPNNEGQELRIVAGPNPLGIDFGLSTDMSLAFFFRSTPSSPEDGFPWSKEKPRPIEDPILSKYDDKQYDQVEYSGDADTRNSDPPDTNSALPCEMQDFEPLIEVQLIPDSQIIDAADVRRFLFENFGTSFPNPN
jgi:hypothetical protein